jgi:hypothetical protein
MLVLALFFGVVMVDRGQNLAEFHAGRENLATALNTLMLTGSVCATAIRDDLNQQAKTFSSC